MDGAIGGGIPKTEIEKKTGAVKKCPNRLVSSLKNSFFIKIKLKNKWMY